MRRYHRRTTPRWRRARYLDDTDEGLRVFLEDGLKGQRRQAKDGGANGSSGQNRLVWRRVPLQTQVHLVLTPSDCTLLPFGGQLTLVRVGGAITSGFNLNLAQLLGCHTHVCHSKQL